MKIHPRGVARDLLGEDILSVLERKGLPFLAKEDAVTEPVLDEAFGVLPFAQRGMRVLSVLTWRILRLSRFPQTCRYVSL